MARLTSKCYEGIQRSSAARGGSGVISRGQPVNSGLRVEIHCLANMGGIRHGALTTAIGYLEEDVLGKNTDDLIGSQIGEDPHGNDLVRHFELFGEGFLIDGEEVEGRD
jgi:hypothetical protein